MNDVDDDRTSCCSVLQQEVFTLKAQVAYQKAQKDTPSLFDVNRLGRRKEFSGIEEDFQKVSKKTEAIFRWSDQGV